MKHEMIVLGAVGSGKTTLLGALKGDRSTAKKTQSIRYDAQNIDTPGEFMENPHMYRYLIATAQGVELVLFLQDATRKNSVYPPGFARSFTGKSIGVISKMDHPDADLIQANKNLENLRLTGPVFSVSSKTGQGLKELKEYLNNQTKG